MSEPTYGGSIHTNPRHADIDINEAATDWLWAVFSLFAVSAIGFAVWSSIRPVGTRVFHQIPLLILTASSLAYFSMASDLGAAPVPVEFRAPEGTTRAIWFARYIDWAITTPLLLLELLLATGLPLSDILTVLFVQFVGVLNALIGAFVSTRYKWGYYTFWATTLFYVWYVLLFKGTKAAGALGGDVRSVYIRSAGFLSIVWILYPICWGVAEGGNYISPLKEMIYYGVLDLVTKPLLLTVHAYSIGKIPYERFTLQSGKASIGSGAGYNSLNEKRGHGSTGSSPTVPAPTTTV